MIVIFSEFCSCCCAANVGLRLSLTGVGFTVPSALNADGLYGEKIYCSGAKQGFGAQFNPSLNNNLQVIQPRASAICFCPSIFLYLPKATFDSAQKFCLVVAPVDCCRLVRSAYGRQRSSILILPVLFFHYVSCSKPIHSVC